MSSTILKKIIRQYVGEIPILQNIAQGISLRAILLNHISSQGNEKIHAADSLTYFPHILKVREDDLC